MMQVSEMIRGTAQIHSIQKNMFIDDSGFNDGVDAIYTKDKNLARSRQRAITAYTETQRPKNKSSQAVLQAANVRNTTVPPIPSVLGTPVGRDM